MPTLEDTAVEFPVTTLNDLLEAEAKAGVTVGADEDKYRRWAFLSTGAAGLLAIILAVVLITGGSDGDGGGGNTAQTVTSPPGTRPVTLSVSEGKMDNPKAGEFWDVSSVVEGTTTQLVKGATLTSIKKGPKAGQFQQFIIVLAVAPAEEEPLNAASATSLRFVKVTEPAPSQPAATPTTTAPAAEAPTAPTPEAPVSETPTSTPAG